MSQKITPFLWFDGNAEDAMNFYVSVFRDAEIGEVSRFGEGGPMPAGSVITASFKLFGQEFIALNGGSQYQFTEAVSLQISCEDQEEVDYYWNALTAGGEESMCGWLKDKFGLSWQVVPKALPALITNPDPEKASRAMQAMLQMRKIVIADLEKAAAGN